MTMPSHHLTTLEGWRDFVNRPDPTPGELLAVAPGATADKTLAAQKERVTYHSRLVVVKTAEIEAVTATGATLIAENDGVYGSPRGLALSGRPNVGKTTALTQFGRAYQLHADAQGEREIPVVYVSLPPRTTGKRLTLSIARFLGLPFKAHHHVDDISHAVTTVLRNARTATILVDEAHHLEWGTAHAREASDHLKYLADHTGTTIVLAGVNLETSSLFNGHRSNQTAGRYRLIALPVYANRTKPERAAWRKTVASLDGALALRQHERGSLTECADYLHDRSAGYLGTLTELIRYAAIEAIKKGVERIDKPFLEGIPADFAAEKRRPERNDDDSAQAA